VCGRRGMRQALRAPFPFSLFPFFPRRSPQMRDATPRDVARRSPRARAMRTEGFLPYSRLEQVGRIM